jgi:hypothetical protein
MANYTEASQLPEGDKVYLKKDWFGYRVVLPAKNEDGSWNWLNLMGGKKGIVLGIFYIVLAILFYLGVKELIGNYALVAANPCDFCKDCQEYVTKVVSGIKFGDNPIPQINFTGLMK